MGISDVKGNLPIYQFRFRVKLLTDKRGIRRRLVRLNQRGLPGSLTAEDGASPEQERKT